MCWCVLVCVYVGACVSRGACVYGVLSCVAVLLVLYCLVLCLVLRLASASGCVAAGAEGGTHGGGSRCSRGLRLQFGCYCMMEVTIVTQASDRGGEHAWVAGTASQRRNRAPSGAHTSAARHAQPYNYCSMRCWERVSSTRGRPAERGCDADTRLPAGACGTLAWSAKVGCDVFLRAASAGASGAFLLQAKSHSQSQPNETV